MSNKHVDFPKKDLGYGFFAQGNFVYFKQGCQTRTVFTPTETFAIELMIKRYIEKGSILDLKA